MAPIHYSLLRVYVNEQPTGLTIGSCWYSGNDSLEFWEAQELFISK